MYRSGSSSFNSRSNYGRNQLNSSSFGKSSLSSINTNKPFLYSIIGLSLIIVLAYIMYNLYTNYSVDIYDNRLGCFDTIKNMLGLYIPKSPPKPVPKPKPKPKQSPPPSPPIPEPKKEVFNIDQNIFTYKDAVAVCKAYDSELATQDQVNQAFKNKANWCNFGWSKSKTPDSDSAPAFFITQQSYYDELQKGPIENRDDCGKPGINGGIFSNRNIKLGANCYGVKPKADPSKITYINGTLATDSNNPSNNPSNVPSNNSSNDDEKELQEKIQIYRDMINNKALEIRPFNRNKWSRYSIRKSKYELSSDKEKTLIDEMRENNTNNSEQTNDKTENSGKTEQDNTDHSKTDVL